MRRRLRRRQPHTAKPYAARRASALTAQLVEMAAFVGVGEAAGKLKAAMLVRKRTATQKRLPRERACQPQSVLLAPSSAAAAAFSMLLLPNSPAKRRVFRTPANRRRANRRTSLNRPPTCAARRPAPARAGRHGAAAAYGEAVCGAPRKCADCAARGNGGVCRSGRGGGEIESRYACAKKNSNPKAAAS